MNKPLSWQYNEFQQIGKDFGNTKEVEMYDSSHSSFRDMKKESDDILDILSLKKTDTLVDIGSGTGTFVIQAASRCATV